jgi:hypothetical protein
VPPSTVPPDGLDASFTVRRQNLGAHMGFPPDPGEADGRAQAAAAQGASEEPLRFQPVPEDMRPGSEHGPRPTQDPNGYTDFAAADANAAYMQQYHDAYQKYYQEWQQQYEIWYRAQWQQWQEAQPEEPAAPEAVPQQEDMSNLPPEAQAIQQEVLQEMQGMSAWGASLDDRKAKFKKLILQYHPDKAQSADLDPEVAKLIFQFVNAQKAWFLA